MMESKGLISMKKLLCIIAFFLLCSPVWAATYNWYFSFDSTDRAAGDDTSGQGTYALPWQTIQKMQEKLDDLSGADIAYIWANGGDIFDASKPSLCGILPGAGSGGTPCAAWGAGLDMPLAVREGAAVHFGSYVTGPVYDDTDAIFDGGVTSWATNPLDGDYDNLPEQAFYMVGGIEEAVEKAKTIQ